MRPLTGIERPTLSLFGRPMLHTGGAGEVLPAERPFQLLVVLALRSGRWVERDELAALFWPEHRAADGRRNLRNLVFKARAALGGVGPEADEHALRWTVATDVERFDAALAGGRVDEALTIGAAEPLEGLDADAGEAFAGWLYAERQRLTARWQLAAAERLSSPDLPAPARRALAERMQARDPCDEEAVVALISLDLDAGHVAAAERRYRDFAVRLAEQLGLDPSSRLRSLLQCARESSSPSGPAPAPAPKPSAAPSPPADDGFIGRRDELRALAAWLAAPAGRAIAIVGPGGAGKSSLARRALDAAAAPALWVELAEPGGSGLGENEHAEHVEHAVLARLAHALQTDLGAPEGRVDRLAVALAGRLLVLDNAETVPALAPVVDALRAAVPTLAVLVTSRTRPGIAGETVIALGGLDVPDEDSRDAEAAAAFDAVRLFEARARAARHGFHLGPQVEAVVEIVERVGGLPLAIELAASWVRLLPPAAIAADLRHAFELLERGPGALPPSRDEHASMQAVLKRSWAQLAPSERAALEDLSVFQAGFTFAAVRAVAGAGVVLLSSLVDKSMLRADAAGRFSMHPLVTALARARTAEDPSRRAAAADRHAGHFARTFDELGTRAGADHRPLLALMQQELADARAAWRHAIMHGHGDRLAAMLPAWRRWAVASGRFEEGIGLIEALLAGPSADLAPLLRVQARSALAWLAKCTEDAPRAIAIALELLASPEVVADVRPRLDVLNTLGAAALLQVDHAQARRWFAESLALAESEGLLAETASALNNLALAQLGCGEVEACRPLFLRAAALQRELGDQVSLTRTLHNLGAAHMGRGEWAAACQANEEALRHALTHEVGALIPVLEFMQGATLIELDRLDEADRLLAAAERRSTERRYGAYAFKAGYYRARVAARRNVSDATLASLRGWLRRALDEGRRYDVLYLLAFVAEALAARGAEAPAAGLLALAERAPQADVYLRATVDACRRRAPAPAGAGLGRDPAADGTADVAGEFDRAVELVAGEREANDLVRRLAAPGH